MLVALKNKENSLMGYFADASKAQSKASRLGFTMELVSEDKTFTLIMSGVKVFF